jgi:hypothetical protein
MKQSQLRKIYPTAETLAMSSNQNYLFGDASNCGFFLVELCDISPSTTNGISHFISLDTNKLLIFDPMIEKGAIVTQRNIDGFVIILETLNLQQCTKMLNIWKLVAKKKSGNKRLKSLKSKQLCLDCSD